MWSRSFRGSPITPPVLREMELWGIGVQMDGDVGEPDASIVILRASDAPDSPRIEVD